MSEQTAHEQPANEPSRAGWTEGGPRTIPEQPTWTETLVVSGNQVMTLVKQIIKAGNVLRIVIRSPDGDVMVDVSVPEGMVLYGIIALFFPFLVPVGVAAVAFKKVIIQVTRPGHPPDTDSTPTDTWIPNDPTRSRE